MLIFIFNIIKLCTVLEFPLSTCTESKKQDVKKTDLNISATTSINDDMKKGKLTY